MPQNVVPDVERRRLRRRAKALVRPGVHVVDVHPLLREMQTGDQIEALGSGRIELALVRPFTTEAKARRSSIRLLVHEPMKTASTLMSFIGVPAARSMYSSARSAAAFSLGSEMDAGSGTVSLRETP